MEGDQYLEELCSPLVSLRELAESDWTEVRDGDQGLPEERLLKLRDYWTDRVKQDLTNWRNHITLGGIYARLGDDYSAKEYFQKALKISEGDGAAYYRCKFTVVNYAPEINELIEGEIKDIAKFGAFIDFGPFEGMVHISQTMDDFVSFNKAGSLTGRESGKVLKVGDLVRARIVAISFKDPRGPKIGLTMRQPGLGKLEWIKEEKKKIKISVKKVTTAEKAKEKTQNAKRKSM